MAAAVVACDDDGGPAGPDPIDLNAVAGFYAPVSFTFDPQGAAPAGDVLEALANEDFEVELNIAQVGTFQFVYRDPTSGEVRTLDGTVEPLVEGIRLTFNSRADADQLVLPQSFTLEWLQDEQSLAFSGSAQVNRPRLQQLFPELYGEEPWTTPTIPGTLTIRFVRTVIQ